VTNDRFKSNDSCKDPKLFKWLDITSQSEPWMSLDDALEMKPAVMMSVGWIVKETPEYITIASTYDTDEELVGDVNCIPRKTIMEIIPVRPVNI